LEADSPTQLSLPWQDAGRTLVIGNNPESVQDGTRLREYQKGGHAAHDAEGLFILRHLLENG
jgi:hypothetical protein